MAKSLIACPDCGEPMERKGRHREVDLHFVCSECGYRSERRPDIDTLQEWSYDGTCETPCGCTVEPDGYCEHGNPSWNLLMGLI